MIGRVLGRNIVYIGIVLLHIHTYVPSEYEKLPKVWLVVDVKQDRCFIYLFVQYENIFTDLLIIFNCMCVCVCMRTRYAICNTLQKYGDG